MSEPIHAEILIIGAGPGGMAAAVTAAEAGRIVCVIDDGAFAGGQIWRNQGPSTLPSTARKWMHRLDRCSDRVRWFRQSRVVAKLDENTLLIDTPTGGRTVHWETLILATGARELFLPFPGWTLPGVVGAGGMQALVKQGLPVAGKRIVVAGTGPLLLAVAALLRKKGAIVPVIIEQAPLPKLARFTASLVRSPGKLIAAAGLRARLVGTAYQIDSYPLRVVADGSGLKLTYQVGNQQRSIDCDYVACGFNLIPNSELARLIGCDVDTDGFVRVDARQRTSRNGIFAVGELTGIGGVDKAIAEAESAVRSLLGNDGADRSARKVAKAASFVTRLNTAFEIRPELSNRCEPGTIICRCEDVPYRAVSCAAGSRDAKLQTRCGMGACQGRVCGPILTRLFDAEPAQLRPPILATPIKTFLGMGLSEK